MAGAAELRRRRSRGESGREIDIPGEVFCTPYFFLYSRGGVHTRVIPYRVKVQKLLLFWWIKYGEAAVALLDDAEQSALQLDTVACSSVGNLRQAVV